MWIMTQPDLKAPFPYFGGKSSIADLVWQALGDVKHYLEPFFGSGAILLARPNYDGQMESVNLDKISKYLKSIK